MTRHGQPRGGPTAGFVVAFCVTVTGFVVTAGGVGRAAGSTANRAAASASAVTGLSQAVQADLARLTRAVGVTPRTVVTRDRLLWVGGLAVAMSGRDAQARARDFLGEYPALFGLDGPALLGPARVLEWAGGRVVRFEARLRGLPVWGQSLVVRTVGSVVTAAGGGIEPIVRVDGAQVRLSRQRVRRAIEKKTGRRVSRVLGPGYFVHKGRAELSWVAVVGLPRKPWILELLVLDRTGAVVFAHPGIVEAHGYVYDPNPVVAGDYEDVELENLVSTTNLDGTYARTFQCGSGGNDPSTPCSNRFQIATPDSDGNYYYEPIDPSSSDPFAEVQAYYHADRFNRWLEDHIGFVWTCGGSRAMDVHVNWDTDNAFYADANGDPNGCGDVTLGQGQIDYSYDADVLYHEFTHGMVEHTADLGCPDVGVCIDSQGLNMIPNSINEGMADYFSMTFTGDPNLGEYAGTETGDGYIRTGLNQDQCPWDLMGESHYDGQIWMGGMWSVRQALGADLADQIVYGTLLSLPTDADFAVAAATVTQTVNEMHSQGLLTAQQVQTVAGIIGPSHRGMVDCHRIVPLDHRPAGKDVAYGYGMPTYQGYIDQWPMPLQWTMAVPENGRQLIFQITDYYQMGALWTVYVRRDQPVEIDWDAQGNITVVADYTFPNNQSQVVINQTSDPGLVPGTYYMTLVYTASNDYGGLWQLAGSVQTGVVQPDAGLRDGMQGDGGRRDAWFFDGSVHSGDGGDAGDGGLSSTTIPGSVSPRPGCSCRSEDGFGGDWFFVLMGLMGLMALGRRRRREGPSHRARNA